MRRTIYHWARLFDWNWRHYVAFRAVVLAAMAVWHVRFVSEDIGLAGQLGGLGLMMSPYVALCLFARWINRPVLLLGSTLLMVGLDVANGLAVMKSTSSTASVALVLLPPLMLLIGMPALLIVAGILRWALDGKD